MFKRLFDRWSKYRTEAAFRRIANDMMKERWHAAHNRILSRFRRAQARNDADEGIRTLHGLMLVYLAWGRTDDAAEAARQALIAAESAGLSVDSETREVELRACCTTLEEFTAKAVAKKLRILRFARAIAGEQDDYVDREVGADEHLDECWSMVTNQLGFPHWLHGVLLCEMAEERAESGQRDEYERLMDRAEQMAIEFDDNGPAAQAIRSTRRRLDDQCGY